MSVKIVFMVQPYISVILRLSEPQFFGIIFDQIKKKIVTKKDEEVVITFNDDVPLVDSETTQIISSSL